MVGYPITYCDKNVDEVMLSDYVVELMKTKQFQSHVTAMFFALLALGSYGQPSLAIPPEYGEAANQAVASEGGKEALNAALKVARSKPALSVAAGITCVACIPVAGAAASPGLCIACGILIAKTLG